MVQQLLYTPDDFTKDGVLKVSPLLWIVIIYLSRHVLILLLGAVSQFIGSRKGIDTSGLAALYSSPAFVWASIPALAVVVTHFRRIPNTQPIFRLLWSQGHWLLGAAAGLDFLILATHWWLGTLAINEFQIAGLFIDSYIISYLIRSKRVQDTFEDFPSPDPP